MTSSHPWDADRPLDEASARAALTEQMPSVDPEGLAWLGSGWEFDVYVTGDGWAVRFPRREAVVPLLRRDEAVVRFVAPIVAPVRVPRIELWGRPGPHFPYPFAAHRQLPGVAADDSDAPRIDSLAGALGRVLGRLHGTATAGAAHLDLDVESEASAEWLEETRAEAAGLADYGPGVAQALRWLDSVAEVPRPYEGPPRLVHNDLGPDHILVDPDSGELRGLLDWTDIAWGDPVLDFIVVWAWRGPGFVRRVLDAYPLAVDDGFLERLRFAVRIRTLHWLRSAEFEGTDVAKHVRWVANAFTDATGGRG